VSTEYDDELLGYDDLLNEGLDPDEARTVLGPHTALPRWEVAERWELLLHERRSQS
jgi:hypothetical protein